MSRPTFGARLFGPGSPEAGAAVRLSWRAQWLVVDGGGEVLHTLRAADLRASARGFNNSQLALGWTAAQGEHSLVLEAEAAAEFRDAAPAALQQRLQPVQAIQQRTERRFRWGIAALVVVLSLPLAVLAAYVAWADPLADWVVERLPASVEQQIGEAVLAQTRAQSRMMDAGPAFEAVQAIGQRLAQPGETLRLFVADQPEINAFAAPGGVVVIYTGLLRAAESPEEVAGVLAHELAHLELHHTLRLLVKSAGLRVLATAVLGNYGPLADWGTHLTELKFSRDAEREADARGVTRLVQARIDPRGLAKFFARLEKRENSPLVPALLASHPLTAERIQALAEDIGQQGGMAVQAIGLPWNAVLSSLSASRI